MKEFIITTSWDDAAIFDKKIVYLLDKYNLKGTFYVPKEFSYEIKNGDTVKRIDDEELKKLYAEHEVGAHSITHSYFNDIGPDKIKEEIFNSKKYLENLLGKEIKMFCYPGGKLSDIAVKEIKNAGFIGARTTELFQFDVKDPYLMGTTINCYPFPFRKGRLAAKIQPLRKSFAPILELGLPWKSFLSWKNLAKSLFDHAEKSKGIFHLWGHSWEIEKNGMWKELEDVFKYISGRSGCRYLTNSEVIDLLSRKD